MSYLPPRGGDLRDKITVERRVEQSDGMGGTTGAWTPVSALTGISAKIEAVKGGESVRAQRLSGQAPADITIRWCLDALSITTADRVRDARTNQTYNIGWIGNLDNHQRFLMLSCEAGGLTDD